MNPEDYRDLFNLAAIGRLYSPDAPQHPYEIFNKLLDVLPTSEREKCMAGIDRVIKEGIVVYGEKTTELDEVEARR